MVRQQRGEARAGTPVSPASRAGLLGQPFACHVEYPQRIVGAAGGGVLQRDVQAGRGVAPQRLTGEIPAGVTATDVVLTIPREAAGGYPASWWVMLAARVAQAVPGLYVRYDE